MRGPALVVCPLLRGVLFGASLTSIEDFADAFVVAHFGFVFAAGRTSRSPQEHDGEDSDDEQCGARDRDEHQATRPRAILDATLARADGLRSDRSRPTPRRSRPPR